MAEYERFDFVLSVLDELAHGSEIVIDKTRFWRLDTSSYHLRDEVAIVIEIIKNHRLRVVTEGDLQPAMRGIADALRALVAAGERMLVTDRASKARRSKKRAKVRR